MELFHSNVSIKFTPITVIRNYSIIFYMPKGYKTLSIKDESWDYAQALFNKQSNPNTSFSSWVSEFLQLSIQRELFLEHLKTGLDVIDYVDDENNKDNDEQDEITLTVIDKKKKEFIDLSFDPYFNGTENEGGYFCEKCKSRNCEHVFFATSTLKGIKQVIKIPSAFQNYLQNFLKENKKK